MKKLLLTLAAMLAAGTLACHAQAATTVKVGASPTPHAEILNAVKDMLKSEGINLEIIEYSDYVQPNVPWTARIWTPTTSSTSPIWTISMPRKAPSSLPWAACTMNPSASTPASARA